MKKVGLLLLFFTQLAYGQQNPYDSLELKLDAARSDTQKLELLKQLADVAFGSDMEKALEYAKEGAQLADKIGDKNRQPEFYEMEGRMHANLLHLDSATAFFNKAMEGYKAVDNKRGEATTQFKIAWVYKKKGELDKAMAADLEASRLMETLDDKEGMAAAYGRVSEDLTRQGRLAEGMDYAQKAIEICEKNNLNDELVYALTAAGSTAIEGGDNQTGVWLFQSCFGTGQCTKF